MQPYAPKDARGKNKLDRLPTHWCQTCEVLSRGVDCFAIAHARVITNTYCINAASLSNILNLFI